MKSSHCFVVLAYKESQYLENCIQSVLNQTHESHVVIATSSPNDFINDMANKYQLELIVNKSQKKGIGYDFDFAKNCTDYDLVTIAHQDDQYDDNYAEEIMKLYDQKKDSLILFTDYYEIRNQKRVYTNTNLKIKRILLLPLKIKGLSKYRFIKRCALRLGCAICCPAVTFVNKNIKMKNVFSCDMKCNIDWYAWEQISNLTGSFSYISKPLMGHRVHEESTTSEIIKDHQRTVEDYKMFCKFWPEAIAKLLTKIYANSEKSNEVKE